MVQERKGQPQNMFFRGAARTGLLFLLTSLGWIAWERQLAHLANTQILHLPANAVDFCSMVFGYLLQAAGLGVFGFVLSKKPARIRGLYYAAILLHFICLVPALESGTFAVSLVFGLLQNLFCGILAGMYLYRLAMEVEKKLLARAFALGYAGSILAAYLIFLSEIWMRGAEGALVFCALLSVIAFFENWRSRRLSKETSPESGDWRSSGKMETSLNAGAVLASGREEKSLSTGAAGSFEKREMSLIAGTSGKEEMSLNAGAAGSGGNVKASSREKDTLAECGGSTFALAGGGAAAVRSDSLGISELTLEAGNKAVFLAIVVFLFSFVNGSSFSFSTADLVGEMPLALVRLVYAGSLCAAAFVMDWDRRYGAVAAVIALVVPFVVLALQAQGVPAGAFWVIGYFAASFFTIFRVVFFMDLAAETGRPVYAVLGLLFGRIGEALGEALCLAFAGSPLLLLGMQIVFFAASIIAAFKVFQILYFSGKRLEKTGSFEMHGMTVSRENAPAKTPEECAAKSCEAAGGAEIPETGSAKSCEGAAGVEMSGTSGAGLSCEAAGGAEISETGSAKSCEGGESSEKPGISGAGLNCEAAGGVETPEVTAGAGLNLLEEERFHRFATAVDLSLREQDILRLILAGKTNSEIAAKFSISENTVKFHVRNILRKAGCGNRKELLSEYWGSI